MSGPYIHFANLGHARNGSKHPTSIKFKECDISLRSSVTKNHHSHARKDAGERFVCLNQAYHGSGAKSCPRVLSIAKHILVE